MSLRAFARLAILNLRFSRQAAPRLSRASFWGAPAAARLLELDLRLESQLRKVHPGLVVGTDARALAQPLDLLGKVGQLALAQVALLHHQLHLRTRAKRKRSSLKREEGSKASGTRARRVAGVKADHRCDVEVVHA
eukprot:1058152-Pleurochrysis_carterae.AAC.1